MFVERCCLFSSLLNMHIDLLKRYFEFGQRLLASGVRVRVRLNVNQAARVWRVNQPQADRQTAVGWLPPRLAPGWPLPFPTPAPIYPKDLVPFPWTSCQMCIRPKRTAKRGGGHWTRLSIGWATLYRRSLGQGITWLPATLAPDITWQPILAFSSIWILDYIYPAGNVSF